MIFMQNSLNQGIHTRKALSVSSQTLAEFKKPTTEAEAASQLDKQKRWEEG